MAKVQKREDGGKEIDINGLLKKSPVPLEVGKECEKAIIILKEEADALDTYNRSEKDFIEKAQVKCGAIPSEILESCLGIAIMVISKTSFLLGGATFGSGVLMARCGGGWSSPVAVGTAGFVFGPQFGISKMNVIFILRTQAAVDAFQMHNLKLGGALSCVAGPVGRNAEVSAATDGAEVCPIFMYSIAKGLHVGATLEGTCIIQRKEANEKFYGRPVTVEEVVSGRATIGDIHGYEDREKAQALVQAVQDRIAGRPITYEKKK